MDEIISLIVANGIFAVLFCGLLVYELKDSRSREDRYEKIIGALNDRLKTVEEIKADVDQIKTDVKILRSASEIKKRAGMTKKAEGGAECKPITA